MKERKKLGGREEKAEEDFKSLLRIISNFKGVNEKVKFVKKQTFIKIKIFSQYAKCTNYNVDLVQTSLCVPQTMKVDEQFFANTNLFSLRKQQSVKNIFFP